MEMSFGAMHLSLGVSASTSSSSHPNEMKVKGVLTRLDEASTKAPNGSDGHKIYLPSSVARKRLSTLVGMGLNYSKTLDAHNQSHKVGVIKKAWIDGKDLWVEGVIWKHDFPESEKDLKGKRDLGMSMEIGKVQIEDTNASVWKIEDFYFLGGTILRKDAAAYYNTLAIAAAKSKVRGDVMATIKTKTVDNTSIAAAAAKAAVEAMKPLFAAQGKAILELQSSVGELGNLMQASKLDAELTAMTSKLSATSKKDDEADDEDDTEDCDMDGSKKMKADADMDDEDMEAGNEHGIDTGDLADMSDDDEDVDGEPGDAAKGAKNRGKEGAAGDISKAGKADPKAITGSGAAQIEVLKKHVKALAKTVTAQSATIASLKKAATKVDRQVTAATESLGRRSVPTSSELTQLLAKGGLKADDITASGAKLSVNDIDVMFSNVAGLSSTQRIQLKNEAYKIGILESGQVTR